MNRLVMTLIAVMMLFVAGCAASGGTMGAMHDGGLPEIAAYDEAPVEPLPAFVPAE